MKGIGMEIRIGGPGGTDALKGGAAKKGKEAEDTKDMEGMKAEEADGGSPRSNKSASGGQRRRAAAGPASYSVSED